MQELLDKINEVFDTSIVNSEDDVALQVRIVKGNVNTLFKEYMESNTNNYSNAEAPAAEVVSDSVVTDDRKKILIVDDSSIIRNYLIKAIGDKYKVSVATGGAEAIESIGNETYDLILLDLMMPGVDGFAVLDNLKVNNVVAPVIIISGDTTKETIDKAFEYNVLDMIEKPFSDKIIMGKINRVLE